MDQRAVQHDVLDAALPSFNEVYPLLSPALVVYSYAHLYNFETNSNPSVQLSFCPMGYFMREKIHFLSAAW